MKKEVLLKQFKKGMQVISQERPGCRELFITVQQNAAADFEGVCRLVRDTLQDAGAALLSLEVFGVPGSEYHRLERVFTPLNCPVTWIEGRHDHSACLYGIQAWAVAGPEVVPVVVQDAPAGVSFSADGIRYCRLGGLIGPLDASRREQTQNVFDLMEQALAEVGMSFDHVVRTWFYNHDLLEWYDDFNAVRTRFFIQRDVFDRLVPASTGIGCWNGRDAALIAGLLAVDALDGPDPRPFSVPSPLQRPSFEYGSAFSRAVEFSTGGVRRLMISGTASIAPQGESVHIGDVKAQIDLTLDVVEAILESREMGWTDISRAIAYFKHAEDVEVFKEYVAHRGLPEMPVLLVHTDICRDNLLFELEADAIAQ